jgi:predicted regulator of Ras-like GTPase activity (Roadblock/LC7/MglB family)
MNSLMLKFQSIHEIEYAVPVAKNGLALGDESLEGTTLAAQAAYITMTAERIGNQLGVGSLRVAAIHGIQEHVLMYQEKNRLINFIISGSAQLGTAEQTILKILSNQ